MTVVLDRRTDFTLETYRRVAWEHEGVEISSRALENVGERRESMEKLIARAPTRLFYGTTTRYGENAKSLMTPKEKRRWEARMGAPSATFGSPVPERAARGMAFARLINFVEGHAGVRPELVAAIADCLNENALGEVPSYGNLWEVMVSPHLFPDLVNRLGTLATKEPMAMCNGCPAATALLADLTLAGRERIALAERAMALAAEAVLAPHEHFAAELEELWGDPHEAAALRRFRALLDGGSTTRRPYQAPVSFRIIPRLLGSALRALTAAEEGSRTMLQAISENPVYVFPTEDRPYGEIWSTGGYYPAQAIQAMDGLADAWAQLVHLAYHQMARVARDDYTLSGDTAAGRNVTLGAAWAYEMGALARPTLLPLSGVGQTDAGSMSFAAWRKATAIGEGLDAMIALLAASASEALYVNKRSIPPAICEFLDLVRAHRNPDSDPLATNGSELSALASTFTETVYGAGGRITVDVRVSAGSES
jgi:histidine ammonia-lyase